MKFKKDAYRFYTNGFSASVKDVKNGNAKKDFNENKDYYQGNSLGILARNVVEKSKDYDIKSLSEFE